MKELELIDTDESMPLREVVFYTLRRAILVGDLKPGEHLMEVRLSELLGVSRTPIREAIRKLELEGLVVMRPRKGAQVAKITEKDLRDVLEVRLVLERMAVNLACQKISKEEIQELKKQLHNFDRAIAKNDITMIAQYDVKFHEIIYYATGNRRLIQILNNLSEQMYRYRLEYLKDKSKRRKLNEEHIEIVEAIENGEVERAEHAMISHIVNQETAVREKIKSEE